MLNVFSLFIFFMVPHRQSSGSVNARRVDLFIFREPGNIDERELNAIVYDFRIFIVVSRSKEKKGGGEPGRSEEIRAKLHYCCVALHHKFQKC